MLKVFCSYSHRDRELKQDLEEHLSVLERAGMISIFWSDDKIIAGTEFDPKIRAEMTDSNIILLLLSASYFKSPYCSLTELPFALARHEDGEAWVVPILMRQVNWGVTEIKKYTVIPRNCIPVTTAPNKDEALAEITTEIIRVIDALTLKGESITEPSRPTNDDDQAFRCDLVCDPSVVVRSIGITELLPDLVLRFHGDPGERRVADIVLTANTNITSRYLSGGITEATLSLSAGPCVTRLPTLSRGVRGKLRSINSLAFLHVPLHELRLLDLPDRTLRISNVRVNAAQLELSSAQPPAQVVIFMSISDTPVRSPQLSMAKVLPHFTFRVTNLHEPIQSQVVSQALNTELSPFPLVANKVSKLLTFSGRLAEYEPMGERARLFVRFTHVPHGMALYLTTQQVSALPSGLSATLTRADSSGWGPFEGEASQGHVMIDRSLALHRLNTEGGIGFAVWELDGILTQDSQEISFGVVVVNEGEPERRSLPRTPVVYGGLAPLSTNGCASATSPIPRFVDACQQVLFAPGYPWDVPDSAS